MEIQSFTTEDGRRAERHVSIDDAGNEIIEIYAEELKPLKLEKRVVKEFARVVAKEVHQTVQDGVVVASEEHVPEVGIVERDYATKEDVIAALCSAMQDARLNGIVLAPEVLSAQSIVEANVTAKEAKPLSVWWVVGGLLAAQAAYMSYFIFIR